MAEYHRHDLEQKKSDAEEYTLQEAIYMVQAQTEEISGGKYRRVTFMSGVDQKGPRWSLLGNVLQCGYHVGVYICKNFTEMDP